MHYDDDSSSSASDIDGALLESEDTAGENSGDDMEVEQLGGNGDQSDNDTDRPADWGEDVRPASLAHGSRAPTAHSQRAVSMAPFSRAPAHEVPRASSQPPWARAVVRDVAPPYPMGSFSRDHPPESYRTQPPPSLPASAPSRTRPLPLPAPRQGLHGPRPLPGVSSARRQLPPPPPPPPSHSRADYGAPVHRQPSVLQPEQRTPSAFDVVRSWPRTSVVDSGRPQLQPRHTADMAQAATRGQHFPQPATSDMYGSGTYNPYSQGGNGQSQSQSQDVDMEGAALLHTMTSSSPAGASLRGMYGAPTPSSSMMGMSLFTIPETTEAYGFPNPTHMNNGADGWAESVFGGSNVGASSSGAGWPPGGSSMWDSLT
ncbi:hypothetical protein EXIGLDRAFT_381560 [Exidia glandulosa HHB12029]|uniref:Uncharacterized protein n=1 Tax=Exidia glandulosa HHB12029 TaxID=1314781 RepID=A0A165BZJ3_EXIGL|nr:hypothetical protein EXIGLDRAFT_381560 [Exidia glandulosa HHB12029]